MVQRIAAAFILFTRLPLWRLVSPPQESYSSAVVFWPLVGWLTGGLTALSMLAFAALVPWPTAVIMSLAVRLLLTGALHEDGLADFFDAFGCGGDRERILAVMKDSHIGTYGVIGLTFHALLLVSLLCSMPLELAAVAIFAADPFCKLCAGQLVNFLPYARPEGAKNKISYSRMSIGEFLLQLVFGVLPMILLMRADASLGLSVVFPILTCTLLMSLMRRKIGGYTGDCCGAAFLLCELSMILGIAILLKLNI